MELLKQSTAYTPKLGPFVDSGDGVTPETGLTIAQSDVKLSKNGGAFAQKNDATGGTHDTGGWYAIPLNTTDTGTLGKLAVSIQVAGAAPYWKEFQVVPAEVYDTLIGGSDRLTVDLADDAITASKFDESTAFPLKSADTGATQIARVGADGDTLKTLSDQIDAVETPQNVTNEIDVSVNQVDTQ